MSTPTGHDVLQFLRAYAAALGSFDARASAELWGEPGTLLTDDFAGSLATRGDIESALTQGYPMYRGFGVDRVEFTIVDTEEITGRIIRVRVRWHYFAGDRPLVDTEYVYVLRGDADGLHAYVGISVDEQQKLAELTGQG